MTKKAKISAQVVFRPASGDKLDRSASITAENIAEYAPRADQVKAATAFFSHHGFQVTPLVGNSLSIIAPADVFEKVFDLKLSKPDEKSAMFVDRKGKMSYELPRGHLPKEMDDAVEAVTFTPPPDFGPTSFM